MTDNLQKVSQLWFSPDVVILRAQDRIFRVFVAILKQKSSVFADMFTFPLPPSSDIETIEGVPVVILHDDPDELEVFLKAIFDADFFMPHPAPSKLEDTLGILRLAHKYDVSFLRRRALEHLGPIYPTRLSAYDRPGTGTKFADRLGRGLATVSTAMEVGALWLLPVSYYSICTCKLEDIMDHPRWIALGEKERKTCLIGYQAQLRHHPKILNFLCIPKHENEDCLNWMTCNTIRLTLSFHLNPQLGSELNRPLDLWSEGNWAPMAEGVCAVCVSESKTLHTTARQECWDQLPEMFGLPGWEELEQMRQAALSP
ncbi:hypothetical protein DFH08DRAFT_731493 [Mycena albidolilacea]|uniref:BTB domain-containing protein n=1 Tax=Mycena albidolilacea TaxID=1033008 RepID=A0AAD7AQ55_9AGAR|nr:hypothetical protein DFH08DRAFT_731493 [Mycena albidolilacea]